jgi:hypothetical protein
MEQKTTQSNICMACTCPCEMHKEHNHPVEGKSEAKVCKMCGHEHKADGTCNCGCK